MLLFTHSLMLEILDRKNENAGKYTSRAISYESLYDDQKNGNITLNATQNVPERMYVIFTEHWNIE